MKLSTAFTQKFPTETISEAKLIYTPTKFISATIISEEISVIPDTVGAVYLKVVTDKQVYVENHFVTLTGIGETLKEEIDSTDQEAAKLLTKWFSVFDKELDSLISKKYADLSTSIKEYLEVKMLDIVREKAYGNPKEFVSMVGIKTLHSQTEKIEFNGKYVFPETIASEISELAKEIAEIDSGEEVTVTEISTLYLEGNRRSEVGTEEDETLVPVSEIDSDD